jgi:hypothetical protein
MIPSLILVTDDTTAIGASIVQRRAKSGRSCSGGSCCGGSRGCAEGAFIQCFLCTAMNCTTALIRLVALCVTILAMCIIVLSYFAQN